MPHVRAPFQFALVWLKPVATPPDIDADAKYFRALATNDKGEQTGVWDGPELENCQMLISHELVKHELSTVCPKFGTTSGNGSVTRYNFLGVQKLNSSMWPEVC